MIEYTEDWPLLLIFRLKGSVYKQALVAALPAALISAVLVLIDDYDETFRERMGLLDADKSQFWSSSTLVLAAVLGLRTNRAVARFWEGTGLLHQMRGEWFDSVSCVVAFSRSAVSVKPTAVMEFRHCLVRLMSLCHASALEEISGSMVEMIPIDPLGLNDVTLDHLQESKERGFNRVEVLLHMMQTMITQGLEDGVLKIAPPILSRVYQTLSRGFVNLLNAKKIRDTRFPFPYAQLISLMLAAHLFLTPMMISALVKSVVWAPVFTLVPIMGLWSLNLIAVELENPFGDDDNDLPLAHFQFEMNNCLLLLLQDGIDIVPSVRACYEKDIHVLKGEAHLVRPITWESEIHTTRASMECNLGHEAPEVKQNVVAPKTMATPEPTAHEPKGMSPATQPSKEPPAGEEKGPLLDKPLSKEPPVTAGAQVVPTVGMRSEPQTVQSVFPKMAADESKEAVVTIAASLVTPVATPHPEAKPSPTVPVTNTHQPLERGISQDHPLSLSPEANARSTVEDFNKALQQWRQTVEQQLNDLAWNLAAIKAFSASVPPIGVVGAGSDGCPSGLPTFPPNSILTTPRRSLEI